MQKFLLYQPDTKLLNKSLSLALLKYNIFNPIPEKRHVHLQGLKEKNLLRNMNKMCHDLTMHHMSLCFQNNISAF